MNRRVWSRGPALSLNQRQHKERECGHLQHHSATRPHRQFRTQKGYTSLTRSVTSRYPMVRPAGTPLRPHFGPRVAVRLRWEDRMLREAKQQERRTDEPPLRGTTEPPWQHASGAFALLEPRLPAPLRIHASHPNAPGAHLTRPEHAPQCPAPTPPMRARKRLQEGRSPAGWVWSRVEG